MKTPESNRRQERRDAQQEAIAKGLPPESEEYSAVGPMTLRAEVFTWLLLSVALDAVILTVGGHDFAWYLVACLLGPVAAGGGVWIFGRLP